MAVSVFGAACIDQEEVVAEQRAALASDGCVCSKQLDPVCGADGVTYSNACNAACAGVAAAYAGACEVENDCRCAAVYDPVCGADGVTYTNGCAMACAEVAAAHGGECGVEGDRCGGFAGFPCADGFKCRFGAGDFDGAHPDAMGSCVAESYCDVAANCAGFPNTLVPGTWACEAHACQWQTGDGWFALAGWRFASEHPYANGASQWQALTLPEGATAVRLHAIGSFWLEPGFDRLELYSLRNGRWVRTRIYTGRVAPSANDAIAGREHYLRFISDGSRVGHGFDVTADWSR